MKNACEQSRIQRRFDNLSSRPFKIFDIVIYSVLVALITVICCVVFIPKKTIDRDALVDVFVENNLAYTFALDSSELREFEIKNGERILMTLLISEKSVIVKNSKCDDKLCEKMYIKSSGEQIICLPQKVVISIRTAGFGEQNVAVGQ